MSEKGDESHAENVSQRDRGASFCGRDTKVVFASAGGGVSNGQEEKDIGRVVAIWRPPPRVLARRAHLKPHGTECSQIVMGNAVFHASPLALLAFRRLVPSHRIAVLGLDGLDVAFDVAQLVDELHGWEDGSGDAYFVSCALHPGVVWSLSVGDRWALTATYAYTEGNARRTWIVTITKRICWQQVQWFSEAVKVRGNELFYVLDDMAEDDQCCEKTVERLFKRGRHFQISAPIDKQPFTLKIDL